jgi:hypothetical protein
VPLEKRRRRGGRGEGEEEEERATLLEEAGDTSPSPAAGCAANAVQVIGGRLREVEQHHMVHLPFNTNQPEEEE